MNTKLQAQRLRHTILALSCATCSTVCSADTWTNHFGLNLGNWSEAFAIATDENDNVYVTGQGWNSTNAEDFVTIAYSSGGMALWTNLYGGTQQYIDIAVGMAVGGGTNIYVTGETHERPYRDYGTVAYNTAGQPLWTNYYSGSSTYDDAPVGIVASQNGKV